MASAERLFRRLMGDRRPSGDLDAGVPAAASAAGALAALEATVSDAAATGASFPADVLARRFEVEAFAAGADLNRPNRLSRLNGPSALPPQAVPVTGARGGLAAATGLALAGARGSAFLAGPELLSSLDLLGRAAALRLPLVTYLVARAGSGEAVGSGHEAYHAAAVGSGALQLFAASVQEALDFAIVARRVSEEALVPALVAVDGPETALAVQEVLLPSTSFLRSYLGDPAATIHPPTPAQEMLYGHHRRRLPRRFDPERPLLAGAAVGPEVHALAAAGRRAYFDAHLPEILERAFEAFAARTGRRLAAVTDHRVDDARVVLVAQGSAVETAEGVADRLRHEGLEVGVVGLRALRPFPAARVAELLAGRPAVAVLERLDAPPWEETPLLAEVRSALDRAADSRRPPLLIPVAYGLGGFPLRTADLAALCHELAEEPSGPLGWSGRPLRPGRPGRPDAPVPKRNGTPALRYLGVDTGAATSYPKRQVLLDALHRAYPGASDLGLRAAGPPLDTRPAGSLTATFLRLSGQGGEGLAGTAAALLHRAAGGYLRGRAGRGWERAGALLADTVTWSPAPLKDPGDEPLADVAVWLSPTAPVDEGALRRHLRSGGALLVTGEPADLPASLARAAAETGWKLYRLPSSREESDEERQERLLGAFVGLLRAAGRLDLSVRKLLEARRSLLPVGDGRGGRQENGEAAVSARVARFQARFQEGLEAVHPLAATALPTPPATLDSDAGDEVPPAVRRLGEAPGGAGEGEGSLPRFWDQVGILYRHGETADLAPDPFLAAGTLPPLTASLRDLSPVRHRLPAFDPILCTGCGDCWTACPDGAVAPLVIGASALLERGMELARRHGHPADALRMAASKLAAAVNRELASQDPPGGPAGPLLDAAFAAVNAKLSLPEERRAAVAEAFAAVRHEVASLPVARTAPFFDAPESESRGSGELFALALDPDACKGCELCLAACEPGALTPGADTTVARRSARRLRDLVATLPDPSSDTVERARRSPEVGALAGALLPRRSRELVGGGDGGEVGSGATLAVRLVLGAAAYHLEGPRRQLEGELADLQERLAAAIHGEMARALPAEDLDALAHGLDALDRPEADLAQLSARIETAFEDERVDVARLRRLVEAARELADLRHRLETGAAGLGRALFGLVVGPGPTAAWAGAFPANPSCVPLVLDTTGDAAEITRGLLTAQLRETVAAARVVRRARLELERPAEAARGGPQDLDPRHLTAEERRLSPALFLVASEDALAGPGLGGLLDLLAGDLPVRLVLLADAHLDPEAESRRTAPGPASCASTLRPDLGLAALLSAAGRRAYVLQGSLAAPDHLERGVAEALAFDGPGLLRLHAPSPERHGFASDRALERAREALAARVFPLFRSAPDEGSPWAPSLDLDGNPDPDAAWSGGLTPAGWALGEERFTAAFSPWGGEGEKDGEAIDIAAYLDLPTEERAGKVPVLTHPATGEQLRVSLPLVRASQERLASWRTLQRLAGTLPAAAAEAPAAGTPKEVAAIEERHRAEIAALERHHEGRLAALRSQLELEMARRVRGRLLALARRQAPKAPAEPASEDGTGAAPAAPPDPMEVAP